MNYSDLKQNNEELKNHLYCVGTIYDSFDALIEVLGKLKLEQPLYLVYLAQKMFAHEVFITAEQKDNNKQFMYGAIEIKRDSFTGKAN